MAIVDLVMPKLGESIMEATVLKWLKQPGDAVQQDETILEIATDKVDTEVPSIADGIIDSLLFEVNDVVPIGAVIAKIRTGGTEAEPEIQAGKPEAMENLPAPVAASTPDPDKSEHRSNRFYSPLVLNIASAEGISMDILDGINGSGSEGRVTKKDILDFVSNKKSEGSTVASSSATEEEDKKPQPASVFQHPEEPASNSAQHSNAGPDSAGEWIEMDRMGKLISEHMTRSIQTSAHVTSFSEADVTNMVLWREKSKLAFEKREGTKLTFTPLFLEVIARCIKKFPLINSSVEGSRILLKKEINIGMATALGNGNLIVPVIRNADQLNLTGLAKQVNDLADRARNNKLKPEDTQGGSFTLTNVGTFGSLAGTPIINQPQVAILAVGTIKKRPVVIETASGDTIGIRHMMYLSMSYDHRIINGSVGASFLTAVAKELEAFDLKREA